MLKKTAFYFPCSSVCRTEVPGVFPCWHIRWAQGFAFGLRFLQSCWPTADAPWNKQQWFPDAAPQASDGTRPPTRLSQPKPAKHDPSCLCDYHNKYSYSLYFLHCVSDSPSYFTGSSQQAKSWSCNRNKRVGHTTRWLSVGLKARYQYFCLLSKTFSAALVTHFWDLHLNLHKNERRVKVMSSHLTSLMWQIVTWDEVPLVRLGVYTVIAVRLVWVHVGVSAMLIELKKMIVRMLGWFGKKAFQISYGNL